MTQRTDLTLATAFSLGGLTLRNRLVATAHATAAVSDGAPTETDAAYWRRLAQGGAGMVITGGTAVAPESTLPQRYLTEAWRPEIKDAVRRRAEAITDGGAVAIAQLVHLGRETLGAGTYYAPVSAAAVRSPREATAPHALSTEEVRRVVDAFRVSAANSVQAGFHGVELHAGHGYLLAQFLSRVNNTRDDEYGDRIALLAQVIDAIRTEIGELPIGVRVSVEPGEHSGLGLDDLIELIPRLSAASPFAYVNVTTGVRNTYVPGMATTHPPLLESVARLRAAVALPLLVSQGFRSASDIERALDSGADLVGMARPFIADPDFARKVIAGEERSVRPCTGCNEGCRTFEPTGSCSVNPELGPPGAASRPAVPLLLTRPGSGTGTGSVAVLGAGPAGMECAMALARSGGTVVVFDRAREVGGQAHLAALAAHRSGWQKLVDYQRDQLADLGVRVVLGTSPTSAELAEYSQIVLATGAEEAVVPVPGELRTLTSTDFLHRYAEVVPGAPRVAVLDDGFGWWQGISAVESALAAGAREVTVITPGNGFATGLSPENRTQLMNRLTGALRVVAMSTVTSTTTDGVRLRHVLDGQETDLAADVLVTVGERRPSRPDITPADGQTVRAVGDCVVPRRIAHAVAEGRAAAEAVAARPL
ncbi:FAD-dependent oxidoreductase [Streptomyces sp. PSKA54]|uniref:FAD-dependent oxidoreductase n=1 Tax=Streptomyces himalayensis subsp. aureolus TaxID=2758039 RepID=A0A7W2D4H8_9ACTN|nr:FAD-dependent oxidoreductase [Streptomyces himalayensis]MBA4864603.1 FAD-dependent oxidoreductase [Streptomyces himalayensis subsp. aureolus]